MRPQRRLLPSLFVLAGMGLLLAALASGFNGGVVGTVRDEQGRPLFGARVRWQATARMTQTDAQGRFSLPGAPAGARLTAALPGYFIAGISPGSSRHPLEFTLRPLPGDHADYAWVDPGPERRQPGNCAGCHAEIYREWSASGHARSATGTRFRQLYEGTDSQGRPGVGWGVLTQNELGAAVCISCHAPSVNDDDPGALDLRELRGTALTGVHCDFCHKVEGVSGPIDGLSHGRFSLRLRRPDPATGEQLFFGPLDDVDRGEDSYSPFQRDSRFCAACHEGVVFGVPVYTTFSEWQASPAARRGQSCQSCHLTPTGTLTNFAPGHGGRERDPATLANHRFFAGSQEAMLRQAITLDASLRQEGGGISVTVAITPRNVGHRVPTGYIDRHLILHVQGFDDAGEPVGPLTGPTLPPPAGTLSGRAGRLFGRLLSDPEGHQPAPFWRSRNDVVDTRLWPERTTSTTWSFPLPLRHVQLRLVYRPFWEGVSQVKGWPVTETVVRETTLPVPPAIREPAKRKQN